MTEMETMPAEECRCGRGGYGRRSWRVIGAGGRGHHPAADRSVSRGCALSSGLCRAAAGRDLADCAGDRHRHRRACVRLRDGAGAAGTGRSRFALVAGAVTAAWSVTGAVAGRAGSVRRLALCQPVPVDRDRGAAVPDGARRSRVALSLCAGARPCLDQCRFVVRLLGLHRHRLPARLAAGGFVRPDRAAFRARDARAALVFGGAGRGWRSAARWGCCASATGWCGCSSAS